MSMTISAWCSRHGICRRTFYNLQAAGKAPRVMNVGAARRITPEADKVWVEEREAEAQAEKRVAA